ncbi:glycosyl hydrolase 108 family protein [Mucilaginibacter sp. PPCGB 2223]|uniref:glycosyl hydrolase 108 family protein n=1 Tax=Mucilaginibacter sp. PPCGB 2223 TaxID=1886027 RepID=UPI0011119F58|nr:glycosyl hydrolase 108 family protein [Mucilaginibacter sp. PPCGB 2223]
MDDKLNPASGFDWSSGASTTNSIKNSVCLRLIDNALIKNWGAGGGPTRFEVVVSINYYSDPLHPTVATNSSPITKTLKVNYDARAGHTYKATDIYDFSDISGFTGAYKIEVTVVSATSPDMTGTTIPQVLEVSGNVVIDRQYNFAATKAFNIFPPVPSIGAGTSSSKASGQLNLSWDYFPGIEEYDLEWTTVDEGSDNQTVIDNLKTGASVADADLDKLFLNNATRITTVAHQYTLSLMYNNDYLLFRMRHVHYGPGGIRIRGNWIYTNQVSSTATTHQYNFVYLNWNESALNWQYSAAFAEEGKKKEVVSYFDGTLRGRQTVTINNSDNIGVVQENIYDQFGRATASILPAPFKEDGGVNPYLHYVPHFNLNGAGNAYNYANVIGTLTAPGCDLNPDTLNSNPAVTGSVTKKGAANYYSKYSTFKTDKPFYAYIPDADRHPLSVTEYTPDNTGRIKVQGGVGTIFQPTYSLDGGITNLQGKATRYYYGKPEQWELDQLFGNDVGFAQQYLKNMVVDPNGQISISYLNASGKTIATALTGESPGNVDSLQFSKSGIQVQHINILKPEQFVYDASASKLTATTTYLASVTGTDTLSYSIKKLVDNYPGGAFNICSNCHYELTIKVFDDCGNNIIPGLTFPVQIGSTTSNCTDTVTYKDSFPVTFGAIGEYHITFEFAFNNEVIDNFTDNFITQGQAQGAISTQFNYIKNKYLNYIDVSGCYSDCKTCSTLLGDTSTFIPALRQECLAMNMDRASVNSAQFTAWADSLYNNLKTQCTALQSTCDMSPCTSIQNVMEQDVSPGGQYALFDNSGAALETDINVLFLHFHASTTSISVFDPSSAPATVPDDEIITLDDGSTITPYDPAFTLQMLVKYWNPAWAVKFLPYHPEICKLNFCDSMSVYENWDERVKTFANTDNDIKNIQGAPTGITYSDFSTTEQLVNFDPFFAAGGRGHTYLSDMVADLNHYTARVLTSTGSTTMPDIDVLRYIKFLLYCNTHGSSTTSTDITDCTPACRIIDREWQMYRNIYFELKEKYYNQLRNATCSAACPVGSPYPSQISSTCPQPTDFIIEKYTGTFSCSPGSQPIKISYVGTLNQPVTLQMYYSTGAAGLPSTISLDATTPYYVFCAPATVPIETIHIKSVDCTAIGVTNSVGGALPQITLYNGDSGPGRSTDCGGSTEAETSMSIPYPVGYDIHLDVTYTNSNAGFPVQEGPYTLTIPAGQTVSNTISYLSQIWDEGPEGCANFITTLSCIGNVANAIPPSGYDVCPDAPPATSSCSQTLAFKTPRFPDPYSGASSMPTTLAGATADNNAALTAQINNTCTGNADTWMTALTPGLDEIGATTTTRDNLRAQLIQVCEGGGDITHPFGSSTTINTSASPNSFAAAIQTALGSSTFTPKLNPWLIDAPVPYTTVQQNVSKTISNSNADICNLLSTLTSAATAHSQSLYDYLVSTYGSAMTLTSDQLSVLQASCSCGYLLAKDITLPVFLDVPAKGCITQSEYASAKAAMNSNFASPLTISSVNYKTILTNYMNQKFGFALTYDDYIAFDALPAPPDGHPDALLCNSPPYTAVTADPYSCVKDAMASAIANGVRDYNTYIAEQRDKFKRDYIATCSAAQESVNLAAHSQVYHYTLYYYDQADNLIRTIPPVGVDLLNTAEQARVQQYRLYGGANCSGNADMPVTTSNLNTAVTSMGSTLAAGGATEMWIYNPAPATASQITLLSGASGTNRYLLQLVTINNRMGVSIYPITIDPAHPEYVTFTASSIHYTLDIGNQLIRNPWMNLVIQSLDFTGGGSAAIYVNGVAATVVDHKALLGGTWSMQAGTTSVNFTQNDIGTLKHLRFYSSALSPAEIAANAADNCFFIATTHANTLNQVSGSHLWYRFNIPTDPNAITLTGDGSNLESRINPVYPNHGLRTSYAYNSTNQVLQQKSPDGGTNRFWYDLLSRLVISQNDKQYKFDGVTPSNKYSYTEYDMLGRISEVGQKTGVNSVTTGQPIADSNHPDYIKDADMVTWNSSTAGKEQITHTYYDAPAPSAITGITSGLTQNNLRKRVAASAYMPDLATGVTQATYYNYDLDGNVSTLYQQIAGLGLKQIDYEFDLVSGKVNFVRYQDGHPDAFYYKFDYDANNRITAAWTGIKAMVDPYGGSRLMHGYSREDAFYQYYLHGPLARVELGGRYGRVQGTDYAYTLQGWPKGVNGTALNPDTEMGTDGRSGSNNNNVPRDAYGFALHYFGNADYTPIGGSNPFANVQSTSGFTPLYNGNIAAQTVNIKKLGDPYLYVYGYDQLNRLKRSNAFTGLDSASNAWTPVSTTNYHEEFTYDANGNILSAYRNGNSGAADDMDKLHYHYTSTLDANGKITDNRLRSVSDDITSTYTNDLKTQSDTGNYKYDAIGNLIVDHSEKIGDDPILTPGVTWTVYGKIQGIHKYDQVTHAHLSDINYAYNTDGQRVSKGTGTTNTYYVRDGQGNILALYDAPASGTTIPITWREQDLYGSSMLGIWRPNVDLSLTHVNDTVADRSNTLGLKQYQLTNHLDNVLVTITDRRLQVSDNQSTPSLAYLLADVVTAQSYYAFGMEQPGLTFNSGTYRYGFNGKENDNDVKGDGDQQDYGMRIYDPRLGRFLSVDPLTRDYAYYTPYQFAGNRPIDAVDVDGLEEKTVNEAEAPPVTLPTVTITTKPLNMLHEVLIVGQRDQPKAATNTSTANTSTANTSTANTSTANTSTANTSTANTSGSSGNNSNFSKYQARVFNHEGGYVDDPADPGGATNKGIIFSNFKQWAKSDLGIEPTIDNLKVLTNSQASILYKKHYWDRIRGDEFENGSVAFAIYDWSVTSGGAVKQIEKLFAVMTDGITVNSKLSSSEVAALNKMDARQVFDLIQQRRLSYYQELIDKSVEKYKQKHPQATEVELKKKTLLKFKKGWENRVNGIKFED